MMKLTSHIENVQFYSGHTGRNAVHDVYHHQRNSIPSHVEVD